MSAGNNIFFSNPSLSNKGGTNLSGEQIQNASSSSGPKNPFLSEEIMRQLNISVFLILCGTMAVLGVISNVVNVIIFYRLGLRESMGVCLFVLSCNDCVLSCFVTFDRVLYTWNIFYTGKGIDPLIVSHVSISFFADSLFLCSGWILSFLSIERCVCVIFPFKVKHIFTKNRSIMAIVAIYAVVSGSTLFPMVATQWLKWINIEQNGTISSRHLIIQFSQTRRHVEKVDAILSTTLIPVPSLVITFTSVLWMTYGLISSSKIRHMLTSGGAEKENSDKREHTLDHKTIKLVQVVLVLAIIFLVCSTPRIIGKSVKVFFPQGAKERNVHRVIWQFARLASSFNAFINIVVYLKINSAYRVMFRELFSRKLV